MNQSPSFTTDSPLDYRIKKGLIRDTIGLWSLSVKRRDKVKGDKRAEMQKRLLNGKKEGGSGGGTEDREEERKRRMI